MVLAAFVGPANGHECRHLNDDPADNRLANLAYGTYADNLGDRIGDGWNKCAD